LEIHRQFVSRAWQTDGVWEQAYVIEEADDGQRVVLTYEDGAPLRRGRGERWEARLEPGADLKLVVSRLTKKMHLVEDPPAGLPLRLINPKWSAPY
jgi:hypothetical protein